MARGEDYVTVTGLLLERRKKSLRVQFANMEAWLWIPRGWLEFHDDISINAADIPSDVSIRVLGNRAVEKGLI